VDSPSGSLSESPRRRLASTNNRMARPVGVWAQHGAQSQSTKAFQRLSGARMRRSASEAPRKRDGHVNLRRVRTRDARPPVRERAVGPCGCSCAVWPCARLCATGVVCVLLHRLGSPSPSPSPYSELADAGALSSLRVPSHCCRCALERQVPYIHTYIPHSLPPSGQPQESRRVWSFVASVTGFRRVGTPQGVSSAVPCNDGFLGPVRTSLALPDVHSALPHSPPPLAFFFGLSVDDCVGGGAGLIGRMSWGLMACIPVSTTCADLVDC